MRSVEMTWLGQAGFWLRDEAGSALLIDPFFTPLPGRRFTPPVSVDAVMDVPLILATHEHDDHLDVPFLQELDRRGRHPTVVVPRPVVPDAVAAGLRADQVVGAVPGEPLGFGAVTVHPVPAFHGVGGDREPVRYGFASSAAPDEGHRFLGYVVEIGGVRLYHAGDSLVYDGLAERLRALRVDVMCLPINGRDQAREALGIVGNMDAGEAAGLVAAVRPHLAIPMHFEGFYNNPGDVGRFAQALDALQAAPMLLMVRGRPILVRVPD